MNAAAEKSRETATCAEDRKDVSACSQDKDADEVPEDKLSDNIPGARSARTPSPHKLAQLLTVMAGCAPGTRQERAQERELEREREREKRQGNVQAPCRRSKWGRHGWWAHEDGIQFALASMAAMVMSLFIAFIALLVEGGQNGWNCTPSETKSCSILNWRSGTAGLLICSGVAAGFAHMCSEILGWYKCRKDVLTITTFCGCACVPLLGLGLLALLTPDLALHPSIVCAGISFASCASMEELDCRETVIRGVFTVCIVLLQIGVADWLFPGVSSEQRAMGGTLILFVTIVVRQFQEELTAWLANVIGLDRKIDEDITAIWQ
jgi:hypothetical protein